MAITALPTPPSRNDPTNFAERGDAFMSALPTFVTEANALQEDVNTKQTTASNAATTATNAAAAAESHKTAAAGSATSAGSSATAAGNSATAAANSASEAAATLAGKANLSGADFTGNISASGGLTIGRTSVVSPVATDGNVFSGTYTPTQVSTNTNVDSVTYAASQYMRVGNTVTVSTSITVDPTAAASTVVKFSLPIASNLGSYTQCVGTAVGGSSQVGFISGDVTNDCATLTFTATNTGSTIFYVTFIYRVL